MAEELIAGCWTSAGACDASPTSVDDTSPLSIEDRVAAVADAGFKGFGIRHGDLMRVEASMGLPAFRRLLDDHGILHLELESIDHWFAEGPLRDSSNIVRRDLMRAAETIGARHIKIGADFRGGPFLPERLAPHLHALASDAFKAGTRVGLEPMPFADVRTPADGLNLVEMVDHPGVGLFLDVWHVGRAGIPMGSLSTIPARHIVGVELDDAPVEIVGSLLEDTFHGRRFPGEGVLDVAGFVAAIRATGYVGPWGVEMLSREFRTLPLEVATRRAFETSMRFLQLAS